MKNIYKLEKFTEEDLDDFYTLEQKVMAMPAIGSRLAYISQVFYRFKNYKLDNILYKLKKEIGNNKRAIIRIDKILESWDEYSAYLNPKEMIYLSRLKNLFQHQMDIHRLKFNFSESISAVCFNNFSDHHDDVHKAVKSDRFIWFADKKKLGYLIEKLNHHQLIETHSEDKALAVFCDGKGVPFSDVPHEHIRWFGSLRELVYLIHLFRMPKNNYIMNNKIWVRVSKNFLDENKKSIDPRQLSTALQSLKPELLTTVVSIVDSVLRFNTSDKE